MSNGTDQQMNCAAQICCDDEQTDFSKRVKALSKMIHHDLGDGPFTTEQMATWIENTFDLAGKGTLYAFKQWVITMFKAGPFPS
jgi:hypothetical protein